MLCRNPFVLDKSFRSFQSKDPRVWRKGIPFSCGHCLACRVKKRREWSTRLALEATQHPCAAFVTLTYDERFVPLTKDGMRTLSLEDLQKFFKRLRRDFERRKKKAYPLRYFAVGEYGSRGTQRPHYHFIVFGVDAYDPDFIRSVHHAWSKPATPGLHDTGDIMGIYTIDPLTEKRVAYCAGYVMKKLIEPTKRFKVVDGRRVLDRNRSTRNDDGQLAEFRTMSRRPGLASDALAGYLELFLTSPAFRRYLTELGDVPTTFRHLGKVYFFDRYLRGKLREALGVEYDATEYFAQQREEFFLWQSEGEPDGYWPYHLSKKDDQKFKQLKDRIKRQMQKRSKI